MNKFVPLRTFIFDRLYNPTGGYFCRKDFQVGQLKYPIDFKNLIGFDDYQQQLYKRYPKNAWLTPSQIFKPYYGMSIANYIRQAQERYRYKQPSKDPIRIVQAGAGTGSAAQSILYYFQNFNQDQFKKLQYHIVQISPALCQHIQAKLKKSFPFLMERGQIKIYNKDILKYNNPHRCYTIFLQVLDNLPHDKLVKVNSNQFNQYSVVNLTTKQQKLEPIQNDALVKQCLQLYNKYQKFKEKSSMKKRQPILDRIAKAIFQKYYLKKGEDDNSQLFLPTQLLSLIKSMKNTMPEAHLIMSDFDSLVTNIPGINAPIVSLKGEKSAQKVDYDTYLIDQGAADIFFPVDFQFLRYLHGVVLGEQADVVKSHQFFQEFGFQNWATSKSGFNPLKQDFSNTTFLVTKI